MTYYDALSKEENIAFTIYQVLNDYNSKKKGYNDFHFDKSILEAFSFEIINDFNNKHVLFSYVLKPDTNIRNIEIHLMTIGITREFVDKSVSDKKRYLAVCKEKGSR